MRNIAFIVALARLAWLALVRRFDTRRFYEACSRDYDLVARGQLLAAVAARSLRHYLSISNHRVRSLLETGCGTGLFSQHLVDLADELPGVDFSPAQLAHARKRGLPFTLKEADVLALPYPDQRFDLVASLQLLPHLAGRESRYCREVYRVLRPGGVLVLDFTSPRPGGRPRGIRDRLRAAFVRMIRIDAWSLTPSDEWLLETMSGAGFSASAVPPVAGGRRMLVGRKPLGA